MIFSLRRRQTGRPQPQIRELIGNPICSPICTTLSVSPLSFFIGIARCFFLYSQRFNSASQGGHSLMAEKGCIKRLQKEFKALCKEPAPQVVARPLPNNILEWHYVLEGSKDTPFAGGYYHGKIMFPPNYPFSPPGISMTTPNGRFKTQTRICLSMSDFHPESWNPMWSVSSILTGLLSFMMDDNPTTGSINTTVAEKQCLAEASLKFNCMNPTFRKTFPEYVEMYKKKQEEESMVSAAPSVEDDGVKTKKEEDVLERLRDEAKNKRDKRNNRKQVLPTWILLLLGSIFCAVMALPLLQL